MAGDIDYVDKLTHFYYLDLTTALADLLISKDGIEQIKKELPMTVADDRLRLARMLAALIGIRYKTENTIKLYWDFTRSKLLTLGFSEKAVGELGEYQQLTQLADRRLLLGVLTKMLVQNEAGVPRGLPGHMRGLWKSRRTRR